MRHVGVCAWVVLVVAAASGCGGRVAPRPAAVQDDAAPVPAVVAESTERADGEAGFAAGTSDAAASAPAVEDGAAGPPPVPDGGTHYPDSVVQLELSATCVKPGDVLTVTITAPANAGLAMVVGYSDGEPHGAMLTGRTDPNGRFVWPVPIDASVPDGEATALVTATGPNGEGPGGTADRVFRVARNGC